MKSFILIIFIFLELLNAKTYIISGTDMPMHNISMIILEKAYSRAGLKMQHRYMQPEKSLQLANYGETDADISRIKKIPLKYPNLVIVPVPLVEIQAMAFSKNKNIKISKWSDLADYNVTIVKGIKFIENGTKSISRNVLMNFNAAFKLLNEGKTDIIVAPKFTALKTIFLNGYKDIKPVSKPLQRLPLYHFVHKKNKHIIPLLTPVLQTMQQRGEIAYARRSYLHSITFQ